MLVIFSQGVSHTLSFSPSTIDLKYIIMFHILTRKVVIFISCINIYFLNYMENGSNFCRAGNKLQDSLLKSIISLNAITSEFINTVKW